MAAPASAPRDWQALYEQAQARADAAEARCEELRRAESDARSRAGSLKWALDKSRTKLEATVEEVKEVRRAAKEALFFQAEVTRLEKLLSQAGVDSRKRSTIVTLRMEVFQLREALQASEGRKDSRQRASLPAAVRAARRGDPRPPERDGGAPRRRDRLAHPGAERDRPLAARVAVDLGRQGCRLLPHRPLAQRQGRDEAVRFGQGHRVPGLRPLRRLHQDGARTRRQGDSVLVLDPPEARLHRVRRRPGEAEAMVRGMGRAVRLGLPAEQGAAETLRPRSRMPDAQRSTRRRTS